MAYEGLKTEISQPSDGPSGLCRVRVWNKGRLKTFRGTLGAVGRVFARPLAAQSKQKRKGGNTFGCERYQSTGSHVQGHACSYSVTVRGTVQVIGSWFLTAEVRVGFVVNKVTLDRLPAVVPTVVYRGRYSRHTWDRKTGGLSLTPLHSRADVMSS
jgi:hypothetical protein